VAPVTGVPERALQAYAYAHTVIAETQPGCGLTWVTLAGIAHIESNHGRFQGRMLGEDGRPSTPIIGIPLNGGPNARAIGDTDGGQLDGDQVWDRAIGPFQFIPSSWARWRSDGDGDGVGEPQDIDDSAVAAARYLCAGNRDLSTGAGWQRAILSYNNSAAYVQSVYATAEGYARDAQD
jgi:membrane-bound lytic murein transglycosylase B